MVQLQMRLDALRKQIAASEKKRINLDVENSSTIYINQLVDDKKLCMWNVRLGFYLKYKLLD
jgi:hypothetical protein